MESYSSRTNSVRSWEYGWGGRLYDATGAYTLVWWIGVGVGAFSALVYVPIRERPAAVPAA